jgi:hypothetical protein
MFAPAPLTTEAQLADHAARLLNLETGQRVETADRKILNDKVDALKNWIMGTLAAALTSLVTQILMHVLSSTPPMK